jgi:hypothetical protein
MKKIFFSFFLLTMLAIGAQNGSHRTLPYETTLSLLKLIESEAIVLGTGRQNVHVFIDPLCPHSRKFVSMVVSKKAVLSKYRFHFYLYSIPRLHSEDAVEAVYRSADAEETLIDIMLHHAAIPALEPGDNAVPVRKIASVAKRIDVYKRPYLFVEK